MTAVGPFIQCYYRWVGFKGDQDVRMKILG